MGLSQRDQDVRTYGEYLTWPKSRRVGTEAKYCRPGDDDRRRDVGDKHGKDMLDAEGGWLCISVVWNSDLPARGAYRSAWKG